MKRLREMDEKVRGVDIVAALTTMHENKDDKDSKKAMKAFLELDPTEDISESKEVANETTLSPLYSSSMEIELPKGVGTVMWYICQLHRRFSARVSDCEDNSSEFDSGANSSNHTDSGGDSGLRSTNASSMNSISLQMQHNCKTLLEKILTKQKALQKIQNQKKLFQGQNKKLIDDDALCEEDEEKGVSSTCSVGIHYSCIVCRSAESQDEMSLIGLATVEKIKQYK
ncbi:hypothetical protein RFI_24465 [Reticulomyxa filosa]|uniref:Uncharacterized protein n=1 Tax=Reticulomyxa filosa TaxID=46433 RepID=X6MH08_RETFI|nr:hypothetical protein RFI_24465 [Reticulomyxa filosa]|eukprot:ETO12911.1 hypothetical protein RFI_24465 [Reticulomyxa filosa]